MRKKGCDRLAAAIFHRTVSHSQRSADIANKTYLSPFCCHCEERSDVVTEGNACGAISFDFGASQASVRTGSE